MLRYIKHNMSEIAGIEIFPIISLLIFVLFFVGVLWRIFKMTKKETETYSQMPLMEEEDVNNENEQIDNNDTKE